MKIIEKFVSFILNERKIHTSRADQKKHILTTLFLFAITGLTIGFSAGLTYGLFTRRITHHVVFLGGIGGSLFGILARVIIFLFKGRIPFIRSAKSVDHPVLIKSSKQIKEIILQVPPIPKNFTTDESLDVQKHSHREATQFLLDHLPSTGAKVEIIRSPQFENPSYEDVQIKNDLNGQTFCWEITYDVGEDIQRDGRRNTSDLIVYGAASQYNGCESSSISTIKPGHAREAYNEETQGPIAQRQFPDNQVELINCAGNIGFNGLIDILDDETKNSVKHGYLVPNQEQLKALEDQLSSGTIEYISVGNKPKNCLKEVHLILVSAFALGSIFEDLERTEQAQFLCALHAYRAQFQHCIKLANENNLPVIFKPTAIGMGVYNNNHEMIAKAFYLAAKEFENELVSSKVKVRLQVWKNPWSGEEEFSQDKARTMASHLLLKERKAL